MEQGLAAHPSSWWRYQWQSGIVAQLCSTPQVAQAYNCSTVNVTCIAALCSPSLSSIYDRSKHQRVQGMRCTPPGCRCRMECRHRMRSPPHATKHHAWLAGNTNPVGQTPSRPLHLANLLFTEFWCPPEFKKLIRKTRENSANEHCNSTSIYHETSLLTQRSTRN